MGSYSRVPIRWGDGDSHPFWAAMRAPAIIVQAVAAAIGVVIGWVVWWVATGRAREHFEPPAPVTVPRRTPPGNICYGARMP